MCSKEQVVIEYFIEPLRKLFRTMLIVMKIDSTEDGIDSVDLVQKADTEAIQLLRSIATEERSHFAPPHCSEADAHNYMALRCMELFIERYGRKIRSRVNAPAK